MNEDKELVILIFLASVNLALIIVTQGISLYANIAWGIGLIVTLTLAMKIAIKKQNELNKKQVNDND